MRQPIAVISFCLLGAALSAQRGGPPPILQPRPAPAQAPVFRSGVEIVHLDVSVLDRERRPVRGLGPADFTILENGQPQAVSVFVAVDIPDAEPASTPWVRDVAPEVRTNADIHERRLFVMLIDDAAIEAAPRAVQRVKAVAREFIDRLGPGDLVSVIFTMDNRQAQDFTADRGRLLATIDRFATGFRGMGGSNDLWFAYSVGVFESVVKVLSTMPDRRKAIVYIGQGVPLDLELVATPQAAGLGDSGVSALSAQGAMAALKHQMTKAIEAAGRANVNLYALDVCGARVPAVGQIRPTCVPGLEQEYLQTVANATGGRAILDTNDFGPAIEDIFEENASYYLLGYQSTDTRRDGRLRRLEVRVNRPGVEVRTRSGYNAERQDAEKRKAELAAAPIGAAISGVLPKSDLPLQLHAVPFAIPGKKDAAVAVMLGVRQPVRETGVRTIEKVDLYVSAFTVDGKRVGDSGMNAAVTVRAGATGLAEYEVLSRIDLKPGRYQLRVAAHVGSLSTSGSLYYDLEVPDFWSAPVSLSGLALSVTPGGPMAVRDNLKAVLPVVPTTRRAFLATDAVAAFLRVYQGGRQPPVAVPLTVEIRDGADAVVMTERRDVPATAFATGRTADVRLDLPLRRLPPGPYLLTVQTTLDKTTARRTSRFDLR